MSNPLGYDGDTSGVSGEDAQVSGLSEAPETAHSDTDSHQAVSDHSPSETTSTGSGDFKDNPAWAPITEVIPTEFHSVVKPTLKDWDRNYNKLAESFAPYKEFSQRGVSADDLNNAYQLYELINMNPQEVHRRLGEALGLNQQQQEQLEEDPFAEETEQSQEQIDPRFTQMQQQMEYLQRQNAEFQQRQLTNEYSQQLDREIKQLQSKYGNFDVQDVMNRFLAQMQRNEQPSIQKAYAEQQAFINNVMEQQKRASRQTPKILSPNGGTPSNQEKLSLQTQDDRVAAVKAMLGSLKEEGS